MITIYIDNRPHEVEPNQNLLQACLTLGCDLPYFCWHPAMHSVGACRQCAVKLFKDEQDRQGRIVMSCMTPVADGMRLSVDDPEAKELRGAVIEWLMLNHPHDCPVCDEGGECHLQDMTVMAGHVYRRTRFPKRTHRNQRLGPFLNHEMNRCIQCYRCVRFYRGIAGGRDLNVFASRDNVYFGRHEEGVLESGFSGNLVEICPTGVFTDRTLKEHYTRKWDLQTAPSLCVHCGLGCNIIAGERYGALRRVLNRYHHEVNGYFLCDRGRFGYGFVNSEYRVRSPLTAVDGPDGTGRALRPAGADAALREIAAVAQRGGSLTGIGSPRASLESNHALRSLVGPENFFTGMREEEQGLVSLILEILQQGPSRTPSLREVQEADAVLVLGEDIGSTAPLLSLAVRQSVRQREYGIARSMKIPLWMDGAVRTAGDGRRSPLFIATSHPTELDDAAQHALRADTADIARLGLAVARILDPSAPAPDRPGPFGEDLVKEIAGALRQAERPLIVSGTGCMSRAVVRAAANIAWALERAGRPCMLSFALQECNTLGLALMGGRPLDEAFDMPETDGAVIILENDLYRRADAAAVDRFLSRGLKVIVVDHLLHRTAQQAEIVLPAAAFAEAAGTLVSSEGRAQRFHAVYPPEGDIRPGWRWMHAIMNALRHPGAEEAASLAGLRASLASSLPDLAPAAGPDPLQEEGTSGRKLPRQPHRYSGRTAMLAHRSVHEPKPPEDPDSPLAFSMEGATGQPPPSLIARYWEPRWNSVSALNRYQQEAGGPLKGGDPGVRLIEPKNGARPPYLPAADRSGGAAETPAPRYRIFGSDELSNYSPAIRERALHPLPHEEEQDRDGTSPRGDR